MITCKLQKYTGLLCSCLYESQEHCADSARGCYSEKTGRFKDISKNQGPEKQTEDPGVVAHSANTNSQERHRQQEFRFEVSLDYIAKVCLKTKN